LIVFSISFLKREFDNIILIKELAIVRGCLPLAVGSGIVISDSKGMLPVLAVGGGVGIESLLMANPLEALFICITAFFTLFSSCSVFVEESPCTPFVVRELDIFFVVMVEEK
jgi:hypothetical protein